MEQDAITIAAGDGFSPVIRFAPQEESEEEEASALFTTEGELWIEGLELRLPADEEDAEGRYLVRVDDGSFGARQCRLIVESEGTRFVGDATSEVLLTA